MVRAIQRVPPSVVADVLMLIIHQKPVCGIPHIGKGSLPTVVSDWVIELPMAMVGQKDKSRTLDFPDKSQRE